MIIIKFSTFGCNWKVGLKHTRLELDYKGDGKLRILLEHNMRCGPASALENRYVKGGDRGKLQFWDFKKFYPKTMSRYFQTGNFLRMKLTEKNSLKLFLKTKEDNKLSYVVKCNLEDPPKSLGN